MEVIFCPLIFISRNSRAYEIPGNCHSLVSVREFQVLNETQFGLSTCLLWCAFKFAAWRKPTTWTEHPLTLLILRRAATRNIQ